MVAPGKRACDWNPSHERARHCTADARSGRSARLAALLGAEGSAPSAAERHTQRPGTWRTHLSGSAATSAAAQSSDLAIRKPSAEADRPAGAEDLGRGAGADPVSRSHPALGGGE